MTALAVYVLSLLTMGGGYRAAAYAGALAAWVAGSADRRWPGWVLTLGRWMFPAAAVVHSAIYGWHATNVIDPNLLAAALLICWPRGERVEAAWWLIGLAATGSRSAWAAAGVAAVVIYLPRRWIGPALAAVAVAAAGLIAIRPDTVASRLSTYAEASRLFAARPVAGWGAGSYMTIAANEGGKEHADSLLLTIAAEQGVIGLALAGWLMISLWRSSRSMPRVDRSALLALALHQMVDYTLTWPLIAALAGCRLALTCPRPVTFVISDSD